MPWIDRCVNFGRSLPARGGRGLLEALLPEQCPACGGAMDGPGYCEACRAALPRHDNQCLACGVPLFAGSRCGECLASPPPFEQTIAPFRYEPPLSDHIHRLKYHRGLAFGRDLGAALALEIMQRTDYRPDVIVPVPLHWKRQFVRGFNQSMELALAISKAFGTPVDTRIVNRRAHTHSQVGLRPLERLRNVRHAFARTGRPVPDSAAVVDDVMTSGATAAAVASCLRAAGIARVDVWAVARVVP